MLLILQIALAWLYLVVYFCRRKNEIMIRDNESDHRNFHSNSQLVLYIN